MKKYCVGFAFTPDLTQVALIRKNRPEWQAGSLNGIGGKLEIGELGIDAQVREFAEETGVETKAGDWDHIGVMQSTQDSAHADKAEWLVYCYRYFGLVSPLKSTTDEIVGMYNVNDILTGKEKIVASIPYMITSALDFNRKSFTVNYY